MQYGVICGQYTYFFVLDLNMKIFALFHVQVVIISLDLR